MKLSNQTQLSLKNVFVLMQLSIYGYISMIQCLRICSNSDIRTSVIEMHRRARVANLKDRRLAHLKNFMFKMKTNENLI